MGICNSKKYNTVPRCRANSINIREPNNEIEARQQSDTDYILTPYSRITYSENLNNTRIDSISPTNINNYKTFIYNNNANIYNTANICQICLDIFRPKEIILEIPCKHTFHKNCLAKWFSIKPVCPLCKLLC